MISVEDIVAKVQSYHPTGDLELIRRAYAFAARAHDGQRRRSGDPYVVHPLGVASTIADLRLDISSVCAGLLHDCVEDTSATTEDISKLFGTEIAFLVEGVTKLGKVPWNTREERQAENFRKMLLAMARDIRVILIKLCDRLDNMRTLDSMPPDKQERIARETMEIYAPLANRLGIQWIRVELEDLSFRYLYPREYAELNDKLQRYFAGRQQYIDEVVKILRAELVDNGIEVIDVYGRPKNLWSIYQKTIKTGRELEQLFDIVAFRAIVGSTRDCYGALGVVHAKWTPIPGRFKDFIALPKPNMYQSLHTSVIGPRSERVEVQIRTPEMHRIAEEGIAAHWRYKEGRPEGSDDKKFAWLRQLMEWQKTLKDPTEFIETVKVDLFADEVYVFTPKGDVKALPKGATPVDFAYAVHTEIGHRCSGARVNGLIVPLRYQLRNGDTVEILTNPNQRPNKDWLKFVVSSSARAKIRHFMRAEQRERSKTLGRELLERELRRYGVSYSKAEKSGDLDHAANELRLSSVDDLLMHVGYGKILPADVVEVLVPEDKRKTAPPAPFVPSASSLAKRPSGQGSTGIKVAGEDDVLVRFGKCCSPVQGDAIVGVITRGRGVTVHTRNCSTLMEQDEERRIEVEWDSTQGKPRPVSVQVVCANRPGLLAQISSTFNERGLNINAAHCRSTDETRAVNTFSFHVRDLDQLHDVMRALQRISGVFSVQRL
ncbi:MAG: bifunctional (p)ppGpp synthetase/guanosine-3',5'-bis(diphosphate) 3'-pyrophosphohydrolase [Myxococcales bacterium]|nr:bifunctional (p)ppGpp synthetase/guanosine-3',5'-bis(diphosphate) 3'-pyrophosphohydrolase [Myxococcota bacterium]MDW8283497.1 bifunctional (p)ppGpp synthetase/guanosine-3',5'-bis(diphosphate) 3'-pyrophosphohydrolase [Myxococcales bacterium]